MAQKNKLPDPNQDTLFGLDAIDPTAHQSEPGISVDLKLRAEHLRHTLDLLGEVHKLDGFEKASSPEDGSRRYDLEQRYGQKLDTVRESSSEKADRRFDAAKWQFAYATGWMAVKHSGVVSEIDARRMALEDFKAFDSAHFGSRDATNARQRLRNRLKKQER